MSSHDEIRHGYTRRDLDRMARAACLADRSWASDVHNRYDIAYSAIAEHLYAAPEDQPPTRQELVRVGWQAIYTEIRQVRHMYGIPRDDDGGVASARRFRTYWQPVPGSRAEDDLIERMAIHQILMALPPRAQEVIKALADLGTNRAAADHLGMPYGNFTAYMSQARREARALWFAPETAPAVRADRRVGAYSKGAAGRCGRGHEWTLENTRWNWVAKGGKRGMRRMCRACERERSAERRAAQKRAAA